MVDIKTIQDVHLEKFDKVFKITTDCGTFAIVTWLGFEKKDAVLFSNKLFGAVAKIKSIKRSNRRILIGCDRSNMNPNVFLLTYHPGRKA